MLMIFVSQVGRKIEQRSKKKCMENMMQNKSRFEHVLERFWGDFRAPKNFWGDSGELYARSICAPFVGSFLFFDFLAVLAPTWPHFGSILAPLGPTWPRFWRFWAPFLHPVGAMLGPLGARSWLWKGWWGYAERKELSMPLCLGQI